MSRFRETLLESELFGYEKGAFTGAIHRRIGKMEQAHGGTVFLDEIGDMPMSLQAKILRLIQEKSIERLGGREPIPTDVRIIAATNRNLETAISEGRFREDLYYRLKVVTIWMPPLRERMTDIPLLADYFLARFTAEENLGNPGITKAARDRLAAYDWPGNVRELSNVIRKVLIFNRGAPILPEEIVQALSEKGQRKEEDRNPDEALLQFIRRELTAGYGENLFDSCMDRFAGLLIKEALGISSGNRSRAAKLLGLSRPTLHSKIEKYDIKMETSVK
ncbi:MAG: sigma-54 dependent transcriptional regulator [Desulfobacterales bacterium]